MSGRCIENEVATLYAIDSVESPCVVDGGNFMAKDTMPTGKPSAPSVEADAVSEALVPQVVTDSTQHNVVGNWDDVIVPHSDNHREKLASAMADKKIADERNALRAFKAASKRVSRLSKWELTDETLDLVYEGLLLGNPTLVSTGTFKRHADDEGNAVPVTYELVNLDGKLHSKVKDVDLDLDKAVTIQRDGKSVETCTPSLSEFAKHLVKVRQEKFLANGEVQTFLRGFFSHENTSFVDVPRNEKVTTDPQGRITVEADIRFRTTDVAKMIQDMRDRDGIDVKAGRALPFIN